jgi:5'-3' exonuclease
MEMLYDYIIVDSFTVIHRKKGKLNIPSKISKKVVDYIDEEIKPHLTKNGVLYMLFDPIIKSDLSIGKYFNYKTIRQEISDSYKAGRIKTPVIQKVAEFLYKFYSHRGSQIKVITSDFLEADDFMEGLVAKHLNDNIAIITNDFDAARFLCKNVVVINKTFDDPMTVESFKNKNGYIPTIASVTLTKALYGDRSDHIQGILNNKKAKFNKYHKKIADDFIQEVISKNLSLDDVEKQLRQSGYSQLLLQKNRAKIEFFKFILETVPPQKENLFQQLLINIRLIKTRCKDVDKYIKWGKEDPVINLALDSVVGRGPKFDGIFKFGAYRSKTPEN